MKNTIITILLFFFIGACSDDIINSSSSYNNKFQSFWEIMDERYVFFEEKSVDWDSVYQVWHPRFEKIQSDSVALNAFDSILDYINDKHISITSNHNEISEIFWKNYTTTVSFGKTYITYHFSNIKQYPHIQVAQLNDSIVYIRILPNFKNSSGTDININDYNFSNGLIVDLRDCTGGSTSGLGICDLFFKGEKTILYTQAKQGKGDNNFTDPLPWKLQGKGIISDDIPLVVLINNNTFSMGNAMASVLKDITTSKLIGEKTGGGGGVVRGVLLPSGWRLILTTTKFYNLSHQQIEDGIIPDIEVRRSQDFWCEIHEETGEDPQLERGIEELKKR
jgi:C-terminal processing protease CtpA/Prc